MSDYFPPTADLPIFDSTAFTAPADLGISAAEAATLYLKRTGVATSVATSTSFNGDVGVTGLINASTANFSDEVNFNSMVSPPHCTILPSSANDLCNKQYVDSQAPLTSYQLYFNYSETAPVPVAAYKKLNSLEILVPTSVPFTISAIGNQLIAGFFNSLVGLNIPTSIPAGLWTLLCYSNVNLIADQSHIGIFFTLSGYDAIGVETILFTSTSSPLITVVSPLIGTSSVSLTIPLTSLVGYTGIGIKLYISSNVIATRTGTIFFQNQSSYSSILTSYRSQQAPDLLSLNNTWTGTNSFNAATTTAAINGITTISTKSLSGTTVVGIGAYSTLAGTNNTLVGSNVGIALTTSSNNAFFGQNIANAATTAGDNTAIGNAACRDLTTGIRNSCLGLLAGATITNQINNTCLGYSATVAVGVSQSTALGINSIAATSNTIQLGTNTQNVNCPNTLSVVSSITTPLITTSAAFLELKGSVGGGLNFTTNNGATTAMTIVSGGTVQIASGNMNFGASTAPFINSITASTTPFIIQTASTQPLQLISNGTLGLTMNPTAIIDFAFSPTAPTPITSDNSTKVATTAFIKTIANPQNFAGLGNSFFNSFLYSNANPNLDYMIAGTLGGLAPVTNAAITTPSLTTFILMGIRLQAGIIFNRYGWNQQTTAGATLRCALYTSNFVYVPNSITIFSTLPNNNGGRVEVNTAAAVTIPITDTYYIYMDGAAAAVANTIYGAFGLGVNVCNYLDTNIFTFTAGLPLPFGTVPFKVATGVRVSGSAPTTNTDLKVGGLANLTYQQFLYGIFLSYTA